MYNPENKLNNITHTLKPLQSHKIQKICIFCFMTMIKPILSAQKLEGWYKN